MSLTYITAIVRYDSARLPFNTTRFLIKLSM